MPVKVIILNTKDIKIHMKIIDGALLFTVVQEITHISNDEGVKSDKKRQSF